MKRKIIIMIVLVFFVIGIIYGINRFRNAEIDENLNNQPDDLGRSVANIEMKIKEGTLTSTGATIIITDYNKIPYSYGLDYRIDRKENGKWKKLLTLNWNSTVNEIAYLVDENNKLEMPIDWSDLYGNLKSGEYRIVKKQQETNSLTKKVQYYYFWVEFVIE